MKGNTSTLGSSLRLSFLLLLVPFFLAWSRLDSHGNSTLTPARPSLLVHVFDCRGGTITNAGSPHSASLSKDNDQRSQMVKHDMLLSLVHHTKRWHLSGGRTSAGDASCISNIPQWLADPARFPSSVCPPASDLADEQFTNRVCGFLARPTPLSFSLLSSSVPLLAGAKLSDVGWPRLKTAQQKRYWHLHLCEVRLRGTVQYVAEASHHGISRTSSTVPAFLELAVVDVDPAGIFLGLTSLSPLFFLLRSRLFRALAAVWEDR